MVKVNGLTLQTKKFPDGTPLFKLDIRKEDYYMIDWFYDSEEELVNLIYLVKHLHEHNANIIDLYMPYIPNARMDRVKSQNEVFTLKYFAQVINSLCFNKVFVLDPHSNVSAALIDNVYVIQPTMFIERVLSRINSDNTIIVYPDEGSVKRYSELIHKPYVFGVKKRNWETGVIESLDILGGQNLADATVLICDDICSRGGTFLYTAKALKDKGVNDIFLYITHCENTIFDGELINSGLLSGIFTTNSILRKNHSLITRFDCKVLSCEEDLESNILLR